MYSHLWEPIPDQLREAYKSYMFCHPVYCFVTSATHPEQFLFTSSLPACFCHFHLKTWCKWWKKLILLTKMINSKNRLVFKNLNGLLWAIVSLPTLEVCKQRLTQYLLNDLKRNSWNWVGNWVRQPASPCKSEILEIKNPPFLWGSSEGHVMPGCVAGRDEVAQPLVILSESPAQWEDRRVST